MSQRLGEWWRESQERADRVTMPGWARALYASLQAVLRPAQARRGWETVQIPPDDPDAYRDALKAVYARCRRG